MKIQIPEFKVNPHIIDEDAEEGTKCYLLKLDIIGIPHPVYMEVTGKNEDRAYDCAAEIITGIDGGDFSVEEFIVL